MKRWQIVGAFAAFGILGPLIRIVLLPADSSFQVLYVVQSITALLWPAQVFGIIEDSGSRLTAGIVTIGGNALVFSMLGILVALTRSRPLFLWGVQGLTIVLVGWFSFTLRGPGAWWAYLVAVLLYCLPFELTRRMRAPSDAVAGKGS